MNEFEIFLEFFRWQMSRGPEPFYFLSASVLVATGAACFGFGR